MTDAQEKLVKKLVENYGSLEHAAALAEFGASVIASSQTQARVEMARRQVEQWRPQGPFQIPDPVEPPAPAEGKKKKT